MRKTSARFVALQVMIVAPTLAFALLLLLACFAGAVYLCERLYHCCHEGKETVCGVSLMLASLVLVTVVTSIVLKLLLPRRAR
jgi:hypothetical protein